MVSMQQNEFRDEMEREVNESATVAPPDPPQQQRCPAPDLKQALQNWFTWHANNFGDFSDEVNAELLNLANETEVVLCDYGEEHEH